MKLAFKFFAIAYSIVLLATGCGGMVLIDHITDTQWDTRVQTVQRAAVYAVDSFVSYADMMPAELTAAQCTQIERQIAVTLDQAVGEIVITPCAQHTTLYTAYRDNEGYTVFSQDGETLTMEAACRVKAGASAYAVTVLSDFTALRDEHQALWRRYGAAVLLLSVIGGAVIWLLARTVTRPLRALADSAERIAAGEYGKTVDSRSKDREIVQLSDSFNEMSRTVAEKIAAITEESARRERFVADFAHEMKTPMTAIIGYAELLHRYELNEEERREAAGAIYKEGKRLEKLSLAMLDLSVYRRGHAAREAVALERLEETLRSTLTMLSQKYGLPFTVQFHEGTVYVDEVLILSLLYNLADNAFKAPQTTAVTVYSEPTANGVRLCVKDNGSGISPANLARLTEPFFREDTSRSRAQGGAGLGLSIAAEIAALHDTTLSFDSVQGVGTTVSFELRKDGEAQ